MTKHNSADARLPTSASAKLTVDEARAGLSALLTRTLTKAPEPILGMTEHLAAFRGKGVRALLLFYAAMDESGLVPSDALTVAAAAELFHLATLVHDDVIDDALLRRGAETIQAKYGKKQAVICGDYLLCAATALIAPLHESYKGAAPFLTTFTSALSSVCLGELNQLHNNRNLDLTISGYLRIVSGKTAALFYACAYAGALVAGQAKPEAMRLARFGRYIGMVFQVIDDCKDYEQNETQAQKTVLKDIEEGVVTLPLIFAIASNPEVRTAALSVFSDRMQIDRLAALVRGTTGVAQSKALAERYVKKAEALLIGFPDCQTRPLLGLLHKSLNSANAY